MIVLLYRRHGTHIEIDALGPSPVIHLFESEVLERYKQLTPQGTLKLDKAQPISAASLNWSLQSGHSADGPIPAEGRKVAMVYFRRSQPLPDRLVARHILTIGAERGRSCYGDQITCYGGLTGPVMAQKCPVIAINRKVDFVPFKPLKLRH